MEDKTLEEAIETWKVDRLLRSYRKTGKAVFASKSAVEERVKRVDSLLKTGELEYVGGEIRHARK